MNFIKLVLRGLKKPTDELIQQFKDNRDANIATIEYATRGGGAAAAALLEGLVQKFVSQNAALNVVYTVFVKAPLGEVLAEAEDVGDASVPKLYDELLAFLEKEDSYL